MRRVYGRDTAGQTTAFHDEDTIWLRLPGGVVWIFGHSFISYVATDESMNHILCLAVRMVNLLGLVSRNPVLVGMISVSVLMHSSLT